MRDLFFTDLKRILKDKLFLVTCIIAGALALVNPLLYKVLFSALSLEEMGDMSAFGIGVSAKSMFFSAFLPGDNLGLIMPLLIAIIICKDFSQGTVRNKIIAGKERTQIFFSHFFAATLTMCALMLLHALLTLGISLCLFEYQAAPFAMTDLGYLLVSILFELLVYVCIAAIVCFVCVFAKNMGLCILTYLGFSMLCSLVGAGVQVAFALTNPESKVLYGVLEFFNNVNLYTSTLIGGGTSYSLKDVLYIVLPPLLGACGFASLGAMLLQKKDLK